MARFSIIETGLWDVPRNEMIQAETPEIYKENRRYTISGFAVLIQDEDLGNVLWDTGIAYNWEETWPPQFKRDYSFHRLNKLEDQLSILGLTVNDIDLLICSHLHYDHAGNVKLFQGTKAGKNILISQAEATEAFVKVAMQQDGVSGAYFRDEIIMDGIGYQTISENTWISDDILLFIQRGHTPGVIGMLIKTEKSGNYLFPSDAVYSPLNYGPPVVLPGLCVDPEAYRNNIEQLRQFEATYQAKLIFSHDVESFCNLKKAPAFYE